jgi:hypothetical protein
VAVDGSDTGSSGAVPLIAGTNRRWADACLGNSIERAWVRRVLVPGGGGKEYNARAIVPLSRKGEYDLHDEYAVSVLSALVRGPEEAKKWSLNVIIAMKSG